MADATDSTVTQTTTATATDAPVEGTVLGGDPVVEAKDTAAATEGADTLKGGEGDDTAAGDESDDALKGAPETYEFKAPEGQPLDAEAVATVEPLFRELNLTNEQAQKLVDAYAGLAPQIATKAIDEANQRVMGEVVAQRKAWATEAESDPEIGGAKWETSKTTAAKALDQLGFAKGSPFRNLLNDSGLGNHPDMIRAFVKIGTAIGEDSDFVRGDTGAPIEANPARIMYPNNPPKEA